MNPVVLDVIARRLQCRTGEPEMCAILFLNRRADMLGTALISGERHRLDIPVAALLEQGSELGAYQLLMFHTHPSSSFVPSERDLSVTRRLCTRLRRKGLRLLDHIILTRDHYFSFRANKLL